MDKEKVKRTVKTSVYRLVSMALLVAISVVLSRFLSIKAWNFKVSFSFVPLVIAAMLYGPIGAGAVAAVADVIGALLFPFGAFFPGYTLTAFLNGVVYGIFLKKKQNMLNIVLAVLIVQIGGSLLLNTYWISFTYGTPFLALLPTRILQNVVMFVVHIIVIPFIAKVMIPAIKRNSR